MCTSWWEQEVYYYYWQQQRKSKSFASYPSCHFIGLAHGKKSACQAGEFWSGFDPWVGKIPLEKGVATHSRILAWRIPWTEEPWQAAVMELQRVGHDWATDTFTSILKYFRRDFRGTVWCFFLSVLAPASLWDEHLGPCPTSVTENPHGLGSGSRCCRDWLAASPLFGFTLRGSRAAPVLTACPSGWSRREPSIPPDLQDPFLLHPHLSWPCPPPYLLCYFLPPVSSFPFSIFPWVLPP